MKKISVLFLVISAMASLEICPAFAEDEGWSSSQLRAIEKKQDRILQELEELKTELKIVKIRVTSR